MTCTGCLHQDYCIHFGCPFVRKPQSESLSNQGGACLATAQHNHCFDLIQRRHQAQPQPRSEGSSAHDLEVRIGAAGKGPRLERSAQAEPSRSGCSADLIQSSGVGPGHHQPRSNDRGRARDRAIGPADSRNYFIGTPLIARDHATGFIGRGDKLRPLATIRTPRTKQTPLELIAKQDCTTARGINFNSSEAKTPCSNADGSKTSDGFALARAHLMRATSNGSGLAACDDQARRKFPFGCVNTGPNLHPMTGRKANTKSGPQSGDWIVRGDVTAAANSQVVA